MAQKISVVMTTYNGERYVYKQLESIRSQTRPPDEVIILDDLSTDNTPNIVRDYINNNNLESWLFKVNKQNVGWRQNFYNAAQFSSGDIVFFSDQDDIWLPDKIMEMSALMVSHNMGCLYGEKNYIDQDGNPLPNRADKKTYDGSLEKIELNENFCSIITLGCCMCCSREVINKYIEISYPEGGHDSQCGRIGVLYSSLWHLQKPVINYRIHTKNSSGISGEVSFGAATLEKRISSLKCIYDWLTLIETDRSKVNLDECRKAIRLRLSYLEGNKNITLFNLLSVRKYYRDYSELIGDIAYKHSVNSILGRIRWRLRKTNK
jgi:glycosyltransferase involved in cell wall biosynthesis